MIRLKKTYTAQEWDEFRKEVIRCGGIFKYQKNRIAQDIFEVRQFNECRMTKSGKHDWEEVFYSYGKMKTIRHKTACGISVEVIYIKKCMACGIYGAKPKSIGKK